jgi:hypothetical protein
VSLFEPVFDALNRAGVRYVVVGGVAVVLHGHPRLTADLDLVVDLSPCEARKAIEALLGLGLRTRLPVDPLDFADAKVRGAWIREKAMRVFPLEDPANPLRQVDLFVEYLVDFEALWRQSVVFDLGSTKVRVASIADLMRLKRLSGRPVDRSDIEELEKLCQRGKDEDE